MKSTATAQLNQLLDPLGDCLTPEVAKQIVRLKDSPKLQAHVDSLATRHLEGKLTPQEETEYRNYVSYGTFVAVLQSKARRLLSQQVES